MKSFFTLLSFTLIAALCWAQPSNDNCAGAIALGTVPACPTQVFTNVNATTTNIGANNNPSCFNAGSTQRDVWFTFTTAAEMRQATLTIQGVTTGTNAKALVNPQVAIYRGACTGLSQIACFSAPNAARELKLDLTNLTPNVTYYVRVNDYSPTATPNAGDFTMCVRPLSPVFNMGAATGSTACAGTLYDSGGPNGDYGASENRTFMICPSEPHACIDIELLNFDIEPGLLGILGDRLRFYAGTNTAAPLISTITRQDLGRSFHIQASSNCVTVQFTSDFNINQEGFALNWQCSAAACTNRSFGNPVPVSSLPFNQTGISTCESAATGAESPCGGDGFLNGAQYVFAYTATNSGCISVQLDGEEEGTGIAILDGLPGTRGVNCVARSSTGRINSANLLTAGITYYIAVANAQGCTPFNISIEEINCAISPALVNALCNPLNGCVRLDGLPTIFDFEDGFQDMQIQQNVNNGCWLSLGVEPNFYWFTIQAQADGKFGFILDSANPDVPSDLDFNVWGPFRQSQVCDSAQQVIGFIRNSQPIRSSWSPESGPTGLVDIHPLTRIRVTDRYDCGDEPGADGDDFVSTIQVKKDEVYVVLMNDWEDRIGDAGVGINWSPSDRQVLEQLPAEVIAGDTAICRGESVQIAIRSPINTIRWLNDSTTLSCTRCPNPVARPTRTTTYRALVDAVCYNDTVEVTVEVYDANAGPDATICRGEQYEIVAGSNFANARYQWTAPTGIRLSCTDCPNPMVTAVDAGTFSISVQLTAPNCTLRDTVRLTVLANTAPVFNISQAARICDGDSVSIGGVATAGVTYAWTSNPAGFTSTSPNPRVAPLQTTTYILSARNNQCPVASTDSVVVTVFERPVLNIANDTANVCQEQPIRLGYVENVRLDVDYTWFGPDSVANRDDPNTFAFPKQSGMYTLIATSGNALCESRDSFNVSIIPIDIDIQNGDSVQVCRGEPLVLNATVAPANTTVRWTPRDGSLSDTTGASIRALPQRTTTYVATVASGGCVRTDTIVAVVDSLPFNLAILPGDTSICMGSQVILESEIFEPKDFPNLEFKWAPARGQLTPDSLYNMVIQGDTTTRYFRVTTSGVCRDTAFANVTVKPIPQLTITPSDTAFCTGQPVRLQVTSNIPDLEKPMWEPALGLSCTTCLNPIATVSSTTTFMFKGEKDGCPASVSATINILPLPAVRLNPQTVICLGDSIQLNSVATTGATYRWTSPGNPNFSSTEPRIVVRPLETTTYRLEAQNRGCAAPALNITVTVVQPATVNITGDSTICQGETLTLTAVGTVPSGVSETFQWEYNGRFSTGANLTINGLTQDTRVRLIYVYGNNCGTVIRNVNVAVAQAITVRSITKQPDTVFVGQSVRLTAQTLPANPTGATYAWTANGQAIPGNGPQIEHTPTVNPTVYAVRVTSANGCVSTGSVNVPLQESIYRIPNAFTPNGDGTNDFFNVVSRGRIEIKEFRVYNRWGRIVYNNENPAQGWNGKHNGNDAPSDVYAYVIVVVINGMEEIRKGDVTLIR